MECWWYKYGHIVSQSVIPDMYMVCKVFFFLACFSSDQCCLVLMISG